MDFDILSFFLGIVTTIVVALIYYGIVTTTERRLQEEDEWKNLQSESYDLIPSSEMNPSEKYWHDQSQ